MRYDPADVLNAAHHNGDSGSYALVEHRSAWHSSPAQARLSLSDLLAFTAWLGSGLSQQRGHGAKMILVPR